MRIHTVTRSQKRRGGSKGFGGPDRYMAVVVVPEGVVFDPVRTPLNRQRLENLGCRVHYCGEFYSDHTSQKSLLYQNVRKEAELYLGAFGK